MLSEEEQMSDLPNHPTLNLAQMMERAAAGVQGLGKERPSQQVACVPACVNCDFQNNNFEIARGARGPATSGLYL